MKIPGFGLIFRYDYVLNSNFKTVNPQIVEKYYIADNLFFNAQMIVSNCSRKSITIFSSAIISRQCALPVMFAGDKIRKETIRYPIN
jgi:hypothetical protein